MNPTARHLNLILYKVGEGGNFLTRLFALSDDTQFLWVQGTCDCKPMDHSISEKLKYYWYFPEKINRWMRDAHLTPYGLYLCHSNHDYWEQNPVVIACTHYHHFFKNQIPDHIRPKYFFVKSSDVLFKKMKKNINIPDVDDEEYAENVRNSFSENEKTDYIDLELLISQDTFEQEYHRICEAMGLKPIDTETALSFMLNWKQLRVDKLRQL